MERRYFDKAIERLYLYYQLQRQPDGRILDVWFDKVKSIPNEAATWICNYIERTQTSLPRNIPMAIKEGWDEYLRSNPNKRALNDQASCKDCGGRGLLWYRQADERTGMKYTHVCRCAKCDNWQRHVGQLAVRERRSKDELKDMGVEVVP